MSPTPTMGKILKEEFTVKYAIQCLRETIKNQTFNDDSTKICLEGLEFLEQNIQDQERDMVEVENRLNWSVKNLSPKKLEEYALTRKW